MNIPASPVRVAVVQAAPVVMDWRATVGKTCKLIQEAAGQGAKLILFPEAFIPAYQVARYVDVAVGFPRDVYPKRLVEGYMSKALPIIDAVKARIAEAPQT